MGSADLNLPWVEKYRPALLNDVVSHAEIVNTLERFVKEKRLPHLLFYGPPGTGKTSTAVALSKTLYGSGAEQSQMRSSMVLELNASDERGIDVVREQIKTFASTAPARHFADASSTAVKLIILDEADAMTSAAQNALRRVMEKHVRNVRFIIICNYVGQIIPALQSRCTRFRFAPLSAEALRDRMDAVAQAEGLRVSEDAAKALVRIASGDMRRVLNVLQAASAAFPKGIDADAIYAITAAPHPTDIAAALHSLLHDDLPVAYGVVAALCRDRALALSDVVRELVAAEGCPLSPRLLQLPFNVRALLTQRLADIEHRLATGASEALQLANLVSTFHMARALPTASS